MPAAIVTFVLAATFPLVVNCANIETGDSLSHAWTQLAQSRMFDATGAQAASATGADAATSTRDAVAEHDKSYVIPALEIVGFDVLLNQFDRRVLGDEFASNWSTIRHNLHSSWVVDRDPFTINQLGHPYQGATYHMFARSAGLDYWQGALYTFAGSAFWEIAGERTTPSRNDQINTGIGGAFFGEVLFRTAHLLLEQDELPPSWREVGAAVVSPPLAFNRYAFGSRFRDTWDSHDPAYYSRVLLGFSDTVQNRLGGSTTSLRPREALAEYALDYGLPGKPGYTYTRPFDYFSLRATASSANGFENVLTRGLLLGRSWQTPDNAGVLGLYGSYDYISPQTFRISSTALSLGATGQWNPSRSLVFLGNAMLGAGYAAAGTVRSTAQNDYHYGLAPQALLSGRGIYGDLGSLDVTAREYFVSNVAAADRRGQDNIVRVESALTWRVRGPHAVTLRYLLNLRHESYPGSGSATQSRATVGLFYTLLGRDGFGAVHW